MKNKCKGTLGFIFGHGWVEMVELIQPQIIHTENSVYAFGSVTVKRHLKCKRCGKVKYEK